MRGRKRSIWDVLTAFFFLVIIAFAAAWLEHQNAEVVQAPMRVIDGDTLIANDIRIRLMGIDAPEAKQICHRLSEAYPCGREARSFLRELILSGERVKCVGESHDKYGRLLGECYAGKVNLNREMVLGGWAISYGGYGAQEAIARLQKNGLWAGDFDRPDDWRAARRGLAEEKHDALFDGLWRRISDWVQRSPMLRNLTF